MLFSFTGSIWEILPLFKEINYPWTMLSQLGFISSLLVGFIITQGKYLKYAIVAIVIGSAIFVLQYAHPESYVDHGDDYYLTNEATTTSSSELMPLWVKEFPAKHFKDKVEVIGGSAQLSNIFYNSNQIKFSYKAEEASIFRVNTIYYPGWQAYIDGEIVKIDYSNSKGVMDISASQYRSRVTIVLSETYPRLIANIVSVLSIFVLFFILLRPILKFKL